MRITLKKHTSVKQSARMKKKLKIRKKVSGDATKPRLCIFRSAKHIYAQIIDDANGKTLVAASTLDLGLFHSFRMYFGRVTFSNVVEHLCS